MADIFNLLDANIGSAAAIKSAKHESVMNLPHSQTGTVVAATEYLRSIRQANATVLAIEATITETIATGADRTVTIDLQKSTGAAAFATILSASIVFTNLSTLRTLTTGTIANGALVDGDHLRLVVTVAGAAGAQALGLLVTVTLREDPQ